MESQNGQYPGPGTLFADMSDAELGELIAANAATVPGIVGINNHMGSKGTEDERIVAQVLTFARRNSLFFLDSRTTANTVVPRIISGYGVPLAERDVFLDNERTREYITEAIEEGMRIARRQGHAVLIGHVWTEELAQILSEQYPAIIEAGFEFATLGSLFTGEK